ncbi:MAG: hypothetical protein ACJAT2_003660 [Bacteriovoracaceae bacterium]|jgi:hypothetical protein
MKKEKNKLMSLFLISAFCLVLNFKLGVFIFGALFLIKATKYWQDPNRQLKERILRDAKYWNTKVPESYFVKKKLFELYKKIAKKERREPMFITSFSVILDEFWQQADLFDSEKEWIESISYMDRNIPRDSFERSGLTDALSEFQNLNFHLEKATIEVRK